MTTEALLDNSPAYVAPTTAATTPRVSFQGELGAYGDEAITQQWQGHASAVPAASFTQVIADVATGFADFGIVPIWNSIVGDIQVGTNAIQIGKHPPFTVRVLGDIHVVVKHQLLGLPGTVLDDIRTVESHPVALEQCRIFLRSHPMIEAIPSYDTAGAARQLAANGPTTAAAIASRHAARRYGLSILQRDIQDVPDNVTQFLIVARPSDTDTIAHNQVASAGSVRW